MKRLGVLALALAVAIILAPTAASAVSPADQGRSIDEYTAEYVIHADGSIDVTIDFAFNFGDESGHGPYLTYLTRSPYDDHRDRAYRFTNAQASSSTGAPPDLRVEETSNSITYWIGDPDVGDVDGIQRYRLSYTVEGYLSPATTADFDDSIAPEDGEALWDEFFVNVIGGSWEIPLNNIRIVVDGDVDAIPIMIPGVAERHDVACLFGASGDSNPCDGAELEGGNAVFSHSRLEPGQAMAVLVAFPSGSFETAPLLEVTGTSPTPSASPNTTATPSAEPVVISSDSGGGTRLAIILGIGAVVVAALAFKVAAVKRRGHI